MSSAERIGIEDFYLEKCIAIAQDAPEEPTQEDVQEASSITLLVSGINPLILSKYKRLMSMIRDRIANSPSEIANIEDTFMVRLASCFQRKESIQEYVEKLLSSHDRPQADLARRILDLMKEIEECTICYTNAANTFFNCGHRVCKECAPRLKSCPYCRASIMQLLEADTRTRADSPHEALPRWQLVTDIPGFAKLRWLGLLKKSSTLDPKSAEEMSALTEAFPALSSDILDSITFPLSEEVRCYVSAKVFWFRVLKTNLKYAKWSEEEVEIAEGVKKKISTPSRLIRFFCSLANNEPVKDKLVKLKKLNNRFRLWIVQAIDLFEVEKAEEEIRQRKGFWIWLFKRLHVREKCFKKYPVAQDLAEFARGNRKALHKSKMGTFNELYKKRDVKLVDFVGENSELMFRNFRSILNAYWHMIKEEDWSRLLGHVAPNMKQAQLVELIHILENLKDINQTLFVYRTKNGSLYWPSTDLPCLTQLQLSSITIYDSAGYDAQGFDREGFNRDGYNKEGFDREGLDVRGYDANRYDKHNFDEHGYNREGYDRQGNDREGFNKEGYDRQGYDREGFNKEGWDKRGYDREGFNKEGWSRQGINRMDLDKGGFDSIGFNREGYDHAGFNILGFNRQGFSRSGVDGQGNKRVFINGYDELGYDKTGYDKEGYSIEGYDRNGLNKEGYSSKGYDRQGFDKEGYDRRGGMRALLYQPPFYALPQRRNPDLSYPYDREPVETKKTKRVNAICIPQRFIDSSLSTLKMSLKSLPFTLIIDSPSYLDTFKLSRGRPPRVPSWVPLVSASGDKFKVNPDDQVVLFIHWMDGTERVDLDLSVMMMSKEGGLGQVDYSCTEMWGVSHSGDFTSAPPPDGASEFITFVPSQVQNQESHITDMFVMCFSYNKVDFDKMGQAFVGIGVINPNTPGEGPGGSTVISGCELRGSSQVNFTSKFSFASHEFTFLNVNVTSKQAYHNIRSNGDLIEEVAKKFDDWEAKRSPPSFLKVADTLCYASEEVKLLDGPEKKFFKRRNNETNLQFYHRIKSGEVDEEIEQQQENKKQILFIGNFESLTSEITKEWPKESLVVSKVDPKLENVVWSSDPYAAFLNESTKEDRRKKKKVLHQPTEAGRRNPKSNKKY